jgi:hypothetical protein
VLILEELAAQVQTLQLAASFQRAMGADVEIPDWYTIRAEFDTYLVSKPEDQDDSDRTIIMRAIGLR